MHRVGAGKRFGGPGGMSDCTRTEERSARSEARRVVSDSCAAACPDSRIFGYLEMDGYAWRSIPSRAGSYDNALARRESEAHVHEHRRASRQLQRQAGACRLRSLCCTCARVSVTGCHRLAHANTEGKASEKNARANNRLRSSPVITQPNRHTPMVLRTTPAGTC